VLHFQAKAETKQRESKIKCKCLSAHTPTHTHTHMNTLSKRTFAAKVQVQHRWRKSICPDIRRIHIHQSSG